MSLLLYLVNIYFNTNEKLALAAPFGRPPDFGGYPGGPPGAGKVIFTDHSHDRVGPGWYFRQYITDSSLPIAPPGMAAPGTAPPPGMQQANSQQPGRPGGFPPNFQPPPNMPNINFSAPVIRLGTSGPPKTSTPVESGRERGSESAGRRAGGGSLESQRQNIRDAMLQLQPPSQDEIVRTVFVGGITEGVGGDEGVERILQVAGSLRRWIRATDADEKPCKFGFAEYDDPESLSTAVEVLRDIEVPVKKQRPSKEGGKEESDVEMSKLLVSRPLQICVCLVTYMLIILRLLSMKVPLNISSSGKRLIPLTLKLNKRALNPPKLRWLIFFPISQSHLLPRIMIPQRSTKMVTLL